MFIYFKFLTIVLLITTIALNVVAFNFSRLTGNLIEKPIDVVLRKGDIYVSVMSKKTKISGQDIITTLQSYRYQLPENEALFEGVKKWYNITRTFLEKR